MSRHDGNSIKWLIPISPTELAGPFAVTDGRCLEICADIGKAVIAHFFEIPTEITWFGEFEFMYCQRQHDQETIKVIRKATAEECRLFRVPIWIQGDDIPQCCGKAMFFVGQIDDDRICSERPSGAKLWWHDLASFYVFTCSQCLAVKAVGQQF